MRRRVKLDRKHRRGIVLLIVVSLLAVFVLVGITFVVVASKQRQAMTSLLRRGQTGHQSPAAFADEAVKQLLRGSRRQSSIAGHDLSTDLWGNDGVRGIVTGVSSQANGQFIEIVYMPDSQQPHPFGTVSAPFYGGRFAASDHAYAGSLATIEPLMWHPGADNAWGRPGVDDNGDGATDNIGDAGAPNSDDRLVHAWQLGADGGWGVQGVDDNGNGTTDDVLEAGWLGSDDMSPPRSSARIVDSGTGATGFWIRVETFREFRDRGVLPAREPSGN